MIPFIKVISLIFPNSEVEIIDILKLPKFDEITLPIPCIDPLFSKVKFINGPFVTKQFPFFIEEITEFMFLFFVNTPVLNSPNSCSFFSYKDNIGVLI